MIHSIANGQAGSMKCYVRTDGVGARVALVDRFQHFLEFSHQDPFQIVAGFPHRLRSLTPARTKV